MFMSSKHIKIMIIEIIITFNYINLVYFLREDSLGSSTRKLEEIRLKNTDLDLWKSKSNLVERLLSMLEVIVTEMFFPPGTGISCKEKTCKEIFQMCLSLSFHNYKFVFKVRISSPPQT